MTTKEIQSNLPELSTDDLRVIERTIHELYRKRNESFLYDDDYGVWTEADQVSVADEMFGMMDEQEATNG